MEPAFNPFSWVLSLFTGTVFTPKRTLADDEKEWEKLTEGQIRDQVLLLDVSVASAADLTASLRWCGITKFALSSRCCRKRSVTWRI